MKKIVFIVLSVVLLFFIAFYFIGVYTTNSFIDERAEDIMQLAQSQSAEKFYYSEIDSLPVPVQKYFRFALKDGIDKPRFVRIKQSGKFKTNIGAEFKDLSAVQYSLTSEPGFIWSGDINFADVIWVKGIDTYFEKTGSLLIKFMSGVTISNESSSEITQAQIVRWLYEGAWYPTALLPSENLYWLPIDSSSAQVNFETNGIKVEAKFSFNDDGSISKIKSQRFMTTNAGPVLTDYTGYFSDYKEVDGIMIPMHGEVEWNLDNQDFLYGKFDIKEIQFDTFTLFKE
jgi:hypothetical protein